MSRVGWPRLRIVEIPPPSDAERLHWLLKALESNEPLSDERRREAAQYLRRFANSPAAMNALASAGRGRPRSDHATDMALDYLLCLEQTGKARAARAAVAREWSVSEAAVAKTFTACRHAAEYRLQSMVDRNVGRLRVERGRADGSREEVFWTRRDLIAAMRADLKDRHAGRRRGGRK